MGKLAICIPTYNRAEMIEEMLLRCAEIYRQEDVDVCFFDSSDNDKIQEIVNRYSGTYRNLFYRRIPTETHSNLKVLNIYREFSESKKYEYMMLSTDYMQFTEDGIWLIQKICKNDFDLCVLNYRDVERIGEKTYTDINDFFYDCAWHLTSYMSAVVRVSFLAGTEWEYIYERYTVPQRINHSHVALLFEQLSRKTGFLAVHVPVSSKHIRISSYRKSAYWEREIFPVWCEYWPDMIHALPDCYRNKDAVIRKNGVNAGLLSWPGFAAYRQERTYDFGVYRKYRKEWKTLTDVPRFLLWLLAIMPPSMAGLFQGYNWRRKFLKCRLRRFCRSHAAVYVYGCGFMGNRVSDLLDELKVDYQGYIVSDLSNEKKSFHGLEVISYDEFLRKSSDAGIIIAMKQENTEQVVKEKKELSSYPLFLAYLYEDALEWPIKGMRAVWEDKRHEG